MNRNVSSLLFFATAVFFAGCSNHSDSFGESGSTGSTGSSGGSATPAPDTDLEAFARIGIAESEYVEPRNVNDVTFVSNDDPNAFDDVF
jgi:hypothetical protein